MYHISVWFKLHYYMLGTYRRGSTSTHRLIFPGKPRDTNCATTTGGNRGNVDGTACWPP